MRLKNKLILSYIVLITLPLAILSAGYYYTSKDIMLDLARSNVLEIVKKNNQIIDERLSIVQDNSLSLMVECDLFQIFDGKGPSDELQLLLTDDRVTGILNRYFTQSDDLYSVELVTRAFVYGSKSKNTYPPGNFYESSLYDRATAEKGRIAWVPTYDYSRMYHLSELADADIDYRYLFSGVRELNPSCVKNDVVVRTQNGSEKPILVMNFKDNIYSDIFRNSIPIEGALFLVVSEDGTIVSHQDNSKLALTEWPLWMDEVRNRGSGTAFVEVGGQRMVACFAISAVTNWTSIVLIPPSVLTNDILHTIQFFMVTLGATLLGLSLLFAYLISTKISSPINKLLLAIKRVGGGDFNAKIHVEGKDELGHVLTKFNSMNEKVKQLIDENYIVKLREKETEILALNIQLNPHFLYNTLNIINWMAEYGQKEKMSGMLISLSRMLHYTSDNRKDTTLLKDDVSWLQDYIAIMKNRFDQQLRVDFDIQPELLEAYVPKLFLQPLVENAIIHGFRDMEIGGLITVYGRRQEDDIRFCVEDNGRGFEPERLKKLLTGASNHVGIQNVDKRIKLLYGNKYGIEIESELGLGTRVNMIIPFRKQDE
jgi:two-component system, sensor histidine kinase YesM